MCLGKITIGMEKLIWTNFFLIFQRVIKAQRGGTHIFTGVTNSGNDLIQAAGRGCLLLIVIVKRRIFYKIIIICKPTKNETLPNFPCQIFPARFFLPSKSR